MIISELYSLFCKYPAISTDSRSCMPDSLFFALKGDTFNGNCFALNALEAGCSYAIIDDVSYLKDKRMILVDNVLETLSQLAYIHRHTLKVKIIALTGTNGKTTVKELINIVLTQKYNTLCTQGNLNNHIGVPLTLLRLTDKHETAVIEMGANHVGEIKQSVDIVCPDFGLITNFGYAHLEGFGSFDGVVNTKLELLDYLVANKKVFFLNDEVEKIINLHCHNKLNNIELVRFGKLNNSSLDNNQSLINGSIASCDPFLNVNWIKGNLPVYTLKTNLIGFYNLYNVLAAITIGAYFNIEPEKVNYAIESYVPSNNRSQLRQTDNNQLIIDSYNANPSSMNVSLENFMLLKTSPKAVILGDMLELGDTSYTFHEQIVNMLQKSIIDKVILCGKIFSSIKNNFICFEDVDMLIKYLKANRIKGYTVLIKGSHGIRLDKVIDYL